jgi:hypothetical protein
MANPKAKKTQEKRLGAREAAEQDGAAELAVFLQDTMRGGLLAFMEKGPEGLEHAARRLVDAKMKGAAVLLKKFALQPFTNDEKWQESALTLLARLWMLLEGLRNIDALPLPVQHDLRTLMGRTWQKKDLLANPDIETVTDDWLCVGVLQNKEPDGLLARQQWLFGLKTGRTAYILEYAKTTFPFPDFLLPPYTVTPATISYYPSNFPQRAIVKSVLEPVGISAEYSLKPLAGWLAVQVQYAQILAYYPWLDDLLLYVRDIQIVYAASQWYLTDQQQQMMAIHTLVPAAKCWQLMALSGGHPVDLFVLRRKDKVIPLGMFGEGGRYLSI